MLRNTLLISLIFVCTTISAQDSTWIKRDLTAYRMADSIKVNQKAPGIAAEYLASYLGQRRKEGPVTSKLVTNYRDAANWFKIDGQYQKAYSYIDTALQLQEDFPELPLMDRAWTEYRYGQIMGRFNLLGASQYWYDRALVTINEALEAGEVSGNWKSQIQYFTSSAAFLATQNQNFARASLLHERFAVLYDQYAGDLPESESNWNLLEDIMGRGLNLQKQERFAEARRVYEEAFIPTFSPNGYNMLILRGNYANSYNEEGRYATAEPLVRELLEEMVARSSEDPQFWDRTVVAYGYLLNALQGQGKYDAMEPVYANAVALRTKIDSTGKGRNLGLLNTFMAEAASKRGDTATAARFFERARNNFVEDARPLGAARLPRIEGNLIYGQEDFLYFLAAYRESFVRAADAGDDRALDHALSTALSIDSLLQRGVAQLSLTASVGGFFRLENRQYQRAIDLSLRLYRERGDAEYLSKAFGFASVQKGNLLRRFLSAEELAASYGVPQSVVGEKIRRESNVLILEKDLAEAAVEDQSTIRQQLLKEQGALTELRRLLDRDYPAFAQSMRGTSLEDPFAAAAGLEDDHRVVEYFLGRDSIYLFVLSAAEGLTYRVVLRPVDLEENISLALQDTVAAARLFELLVAPVVATAAEGTRLQFIPDGVLWNVPFTALMEGGEYLIERHAISYAYASSMLFTDAIASVNKPAYLGFGISYDDVIERINAAAQRSGIEGKLRDMGQLPYARREVDEVASLFGSNPYLEERATKRQFMDAAPEGGILHLAMHGILQPNPMESALVFRGEDQEELELLRMRELLGRRFPAQLTVLSACHSGNGPLEVSEGRQSIGRAFAAAGSRATITSNWAAPDRATYTILQRAFARIKAGWTTDEALRDGVRYYLKESTQTQRAPVNWAHLTLTGHTIPVEGTTAWWWWLAAIAGLAGLWLVTKWRRP